MKKIILALFLLFGFANAEFIIKDENGNEQRISDEGLVNINVDADKQSMNFEINATQISYSSLFLNNTSGSNLLIRFDASQRAKDDDDKEINKQIIFQAGAQDNLFVSPFYALTSCQTDKSTKNKPTKSFFIINNNDKKFLFFQIRDCETGELDPTTQPSVITTFTAIKTSMSDINTNYSGDENLGAPIGLPTVIIGKEAKRNLADGSRYGGEFACKDDKLSNVKSIKLYDGSNNDITEKVNLKQDLNSAEITFTIPNDDINYRKMHFRVECKEQKQNKSKQNVQVFYLDARPKQIVVSGLPNKGDWLYAEYEYKSNGEVYKNDPFVLAEKSLGDANKIEQNKVMKAISLKAVDANDNIVKNFYSISDIDIFGKIYTDGSNGRDNELLNNNTLNRICTSGSTDGCAIAYAEINSDKSEVFTHINNLDGENNRVLSYNNVGQTMLYGVDTEWTKFSQSFASGAEYNENYQISKSILCDMDETHDDEQAKTINGKTRNIVGCNIPFVAEDGSDELNFYFFRPAVYNLVFDSKNSPANESYGTDKFTYMRTITKDDFEFETADFNASLLAIGASLDSLEQGRTLSHYDNHLKVADKLKFSGNPANPTITLEGTSTQNDIATDFNITVKDDEADLNGALIATLEPEEPYNHEKGYKDTAKLTEIKSKEDLVISRDKDNFYAGKNIKVNKLNFKREDLLARSYIHLGLASVNIDITDPKNEELSKKITDEKAAFVFSYKGDDINIIDAAIIAPNLASNETTTDGAVYLAGYCEPTSRATCKEGGVFISNTIAGHMNYFGFDFLTYGKHDTDVKESTTDSLFEYSGATFAQFKRGADFLSSFEANEVKIMLKGDKAEDYCKIFRNCYELENGKFGTTFNSYKASITPWHGSGDKQGKTIVDSIAKDNKNTRRKEQRLSF